MQVSVEHESPRVIEVQLAGRLTSQAWHATLKDVAKLLRPQERASILLAAQGFEGWEPGDWDDLSFSGKMTSALRGSRSLQIRNGQTRC